MKNYLSLFALLMLIIPMSVHADPLKLKAQKAGEIAGAIADLDKGMDVEIKQGSEASKILHKAYEVDGKARIALAQDLTALKAAGDAFEKSRLELIKSIGGDNGIDQKDAKQMKEFNEGFQKLIDTDVTVEITKVHYEDFMLEHNPGLVVILSELQPIIVVDSPAK